MVLKLLIKALQSCEVSTVTVGWESLRKPRAACGPQGRALRSITDRWCLSSTVSKVLPQPLRPHPQGTINLPQRPLEVGPVEHLSSMQKTPSFLLQHGRLGMGVERKWEVELQLLSRCERTEL